MKFRFVILAVALMATTAGVVSTYIPKPISEPIGVSYPSGVMQPLTSAGPHREPTSTAQKAVAFDTARLPVPVLLVSRRPMVSLAEAASNPSPADADAAPLGKITEKAAKAAIEADGYKGVTALRQGPDGVWSARALRGQTEVLLSVNSTGDVSAN